MIQITLLFFGALKNHFSASFQLEIEPNSTLEEVVKLLCDRNSTATELIMQCQLAVNSVLETTDYIITKECEIAVLPPFSGG